MTELGWGILATGGIARAFAADLRVTGFEISAVGSRSQESAEAFAAEFGIPRAHGSYAGLMADDSVDIVYVATPHPMHYDTARLALEAGKHVLVEKPFTVNRAEAEALRRLAAERGLLVMEAMWTRYLPHMARIREIIAAGTLGEIRAVSAQHAQSLSTDPVHRINALALGGGALLDLGIYPISFVWGVLGAPEIIRATGHLLDTGADAEVAVTMTHSGGAVSTSLASSRVAGSNVASILGTEARIEIERVWFFPTSFRVIATDGSVIEEYDGSVEGRGMHCQARAAERLIREGRLEGDILPIAESVEIMGTMDEIRRQIGVRYPGEEAAHG